MTPARRFENRRIVVTGARGFIGARLVQALTEREGAHVVALVRPGGRNPWKDRANVTRIAADGSPDQLRAALTGADAVVNLAYDFSATEQELLAQFDTLLEAARAAGVGAFVQFSSIAVYDGWPGGDLTEASPADGPGYPYKLIKREMERRLATSGVPHTILQPTIVYGAGSPQWTEKVLDQFRTGAVVLPDGQEGLCHAVHVDDVVDAVLAALSLPAQAGGRYIISGPAPVGWRTFYAAHAALLGKPGPTLTPMTAPAAPPGPSALPSPLARSLTRFIRNVVPAGWIAAAKRNLARLKGGGATVHRPWPGEIALLTARGSCAIDRARRELGYDPKVDFDEGIKRIAAAMKR